jgi:hypothetical protein
MRMMRVLGIALIASGAGILFWGGAFTDSREVLEVGGVTVLVEESRPVNPWTAGAVFLTGVTLTVIGMVADPRRKA